MRSASSHASAGVTTRSPSASAFARLLRALGQPDAHVDAGVAQRQRVRVALAAVAEDGDLAALDDRQVGVVVVEHLGHGVGLLLRCVGGGTDGGRSGRVATVGARRAAAASGR